MYLMTTTNNTASKKTAEAIEVLRNGGYFRNALENGYMGREQFKTRLYTADRRVVAGHGPASLRAVQAHVTLTQRSERSSVWPTYYTLAAVEVAA